MSYLYTSFYKSMSIYILCIILYTIFKLFLLIFIYRAIFPLCLLNAE